MGASLVYSIDKIANTLRTANASLIATGPIFDEGGCGDSLKSRRA